MERKEYARRWRAANLESVRKRSREWAQANYDSKTGQEKTRRWREKNPEKAAYADKKSRLKPYKLTPEEYDAKLQEQNGVCAICKKLDDRALGVDHKHLTGLNRGLLCRRCNLGLEHFCESVTALESAIEYLKKWGVDV